MRGWKTPHIDIPYILTRIGGTFLSRIDLWALIHEVRKPRLSVYFNSTRCGVRKPSLVPRTNLISIGLMRGSIPTFLIAQDVAPVPRTGRHTMVCLYIRLMRASALLWEDRIQADTFIFKCPVALPRGLSLFFLPYSWQPFALPPSNSTCDIVNLNKI